MQGLGGQRTSPDYEPPFWIAKPCFSCGLLGFLTKNVVKLMLFFMFLNATRCFSCGLLMFLTENVTKVL